MKTTYLFPQKYRLLYLTIFTISIILLLVMLYADYSENDEFRHAILHFFGFAKNEKLIFSSSFYTLYADEILMVTCITSGLLYAFSREKLEDEMVMAIRLSSLTWATIANYLIIMLTYVIVYGGEVFYLIYSAVLSQLIIFILLFRYKMYRFKKSATYEE